MDTRLQWSLSEKIGVSAAVGAIALAIIVIYAATTSKVDVLPRAFLGAGSVLVMGIALCALASLGGHRRYLAATALCINKLRPLLTFGSLEYTEETVVRLLQMQAAFTQLQQALDVNCERSLWGREKAVPFSPISSAIDHFLDQFNTLARDYAHVGRPDVLARLTDREVALQAYWYDLRRVFRTEDEVTQEFAKVPTLNSMKDLFEIYCPSWKQLGLISEDLDRQIRAVLDRFIALQSKFNETRTAVQLHPRQANVLANAQQWHDDYVALQDDFERLRRELWPVQ